MGEYQKSIVIDACGPLCGQGKGYELYIKGGITAAFCTMDPVNAYLDDTVKAFVHYLDLFRRQEGRIMQILTVDDIYKAKKENKLGIVLMFQGTNPLQGNLTMLELYYRLGIRQIMLCYNQKNIVGDGCTEPGNGGLSVFGEKAVKEMNRLGIVVDVAHTGHRTAMEAIEVSDKPVVVSHANAYSVYPNERNLKDDLMIAIAKKGGVVGLNVTPYFLSSVKYPKVDVFLDHLDYMVNTIGIDHVAIGTDYFIYQGGVSTDEECLAFYNKQIELGIWSKTSWPAPPWRCPEEIATPDLLPNLEPALRSRGYADSDIRKILGENYLNVLKNVWK